MGSTGEVLMHGAFKSALVAGALMLLAGGLGLLFHQPWLFPSLGPTVMIQVLAPDQPSARLRSVLLGHGIGLVAGIAAVGLLGLADAPPALGGGALGPDRVLASTLAVMLTVLGGVLLRAVHPPAAATTLLLALGGMQSSPHGIGGVIVGVVVVGMAGEAARRRVLRQRG